MKTTFFNGRIFTGDQFINEGIVHIQDNLIADVVMNGYAQHASAATMHPDSAGHTEPQEHTLIDLQNGLLVPAFIDIQIYGGHGQLFGEHPSVEALKATREYSLQGGATNILPTVATNSQAIMFAAIDAVREYWAQGLPGVVGLHLEGPYISRIRRGAHIPAFIVHPTLKDATALMERGRGIIKLMTLAPEVCPPEVINYLHENGVILSAGHTDANFEEATNAFNNKVHLATHLFNVMSPMQHRAPGTVGAIFQSQHALASIIADGHHVDFSVLSIAKKIMGERLFLITDAVTENNSGMYQHRLQGDKYVVSDGTLSGSALTMLRSIQNCVEKVGISLEESLRMASLYPARAMKMDDVAGRIQPGYNADLLWLSDQLQLKGIYTNGSFMRIGS